MSETPEEWLENLFEFEYCAECGGDGEDHEVCLVPGIGTYFARCRRADEAETDGMSPSDDTSPADTDPSRNQHNSTKEGTTMTSVDDKRWPMTTARKGETHLKDEDGLDLFDEVTDGITLTAIYIRYVDGTRWPARTVNVTDPVNPLHPQDVLNAWADRFLNNGGKKRVQGGIIRDYRNQPTIIPVGESPCIKMDAVPASLVD